LELLPTKALIANCNGKQTTKANLIRLIVENARKDYMSGNIPPTIIPDITIMEYGVGRPISVTEALKAFVRPNVILELMPREQRLAITPEGFMDVIQMQVKPLSEFYQFRATGEIIHRDVFIDLEATTLFMVIWYCIILMQHPVVFIHNDLGFFLSNEFQIVTESRPRMLQK